MESKQMKSYNLPSDIPLLSQIDAKPKSLFILLIFIGFIFLMFKYSLVYGMIIIVSSSFMALFLPPAILIQFFKDYLVIYNKADRYLCQLLYYEEIESWYYCKGKLKDYLIIEMIDGTSYKVDAFSKTIFESQMKVFLKDKQKKNVK